MATKKQEIEKRQMLIGCIALAFVALIVLGLLVWGVTAFVSWLRSDPTEEEYTALTAEQKQIVAHAKDVDSLLSLPTEAFRARLGNRRLGGRDLREIFNDLNDIQLPTAQTLGIPAPKSRAEIQTHAERLKDLSDIPHLTLHEGMTHSVPRLTPRTARLIERISGAFADSLERRGLPKYNLVLTSALRTEEDINSLRTGNRNASANSCHRYGTTFDISWKRFRSTSTDKDIYEDRLKAILSEVIYDFRELGTCYVVYERFQACYHITAR